jgi:hypothetical protein
LLPRKPTLPSPHADRTNPIDRLLDAWIAQQHLTTPSAIDDAAFLRRVTLDLIGLLPTPTERAEFLADVSSEKRTRLVRSLLARDIDYAEHWLTFWNDLLRNDYAGTGFITGGRKQISRWLYDALVTNKPYDQFARELIAPPSDESAGFGEGIRWRGEVSAGQTVEIQFAQSVGQAFLGINLKCASCHDSFIDRWTLDDAYGLAAIYSQRPLLIHRCDKPTGKTAQAKWLFPELGKIDPNAPQPERLRQLARLLTQRENGRFTRTIVNRLWHRLMGHGLVHPTDSMQTEPWNAELLDYLAEDLADHQYDLKHTLELIATSQAYQARAESVTDEMNTKTYCYAGPRSKRLTAEQFMDVVWQLTGAAPRSFDAPVIRGLPDPQVARDRPATGSWIWSQSDSQHVAADETVTFRKQYEWPKVSTGVIAAIACDNSYTLYVNGKPLQSGQRWDSPDLVSLTGLKPGKNDILIVARNGGSGPNPAGLYFEARWTERDGTPARLLSDESWEWTRKRPDAKGKFKEPPNDWKPAAKVATQETWMPRVADQLAMLLSRTTSGSQRMVRASLLKSDFLTRSLGRPNRDQIVSVRPQELTTLEAIDLSNGTALAHLLHQGAERLQARTWKSSEELIAWVWEFALGREPTSRERQTLVESLGETPSTESIEDMLWVVVALPEFQFVR